MTKQFLPKSRWLVTIILLLVLGFGQMWGAKITYIFSSAAWAASPANWSGSKNGNQFNTSATPLGVQVCEGQSGVTVTSPTSYTNITKVEVVYSSSSKATGSINIKIGTNSALGAQSISKSQTRTTLTFTPASAQTGSVVMTCNVSKNSMGINSVTIYYETAVTLSRNSGAADGSVKFAHDATAYTTSTFTPVTRGGYNCTGYWTASSGGTQILNADGSFAAANVSVSTTSYITSSKWAYEGATLTLHAQWESAAACSENPSIGAASLNGSFNMTSTTSAIGVASGTCSTGNAACDWTDYGFVWSDGANTTTPTVGGTNCNKVKVGESGTGTSWTGSITPSGSTTPTSWTTGHTYYVRTYGKNSKTGAEFVHGTAFSFTPRSITFNSNGGSAVSTIYVNSGTAASAPTAPTRSHYTFGGWYTASDLKTAVDWSSTISEDKTYYAKWTEDPYKTVVFKNNDDEIDGYASVKVYVGERPTPPTMTDGHSTGDACDEDSETFYGWTTSTWSGTIATQASMEEDYTVYAKGANLPVVAAGDPATITYNAVWAESVGVPSDEYQLVTNISQLSAGDKIVIANAGSSSTYLMSKDTVTEAGYQFRKVAQGGTFSISSSKITISTIASSSTDRTNPHVFTVGKSGDYWTFYDPLNSAYLSCVSTSDKNSLGYETTLSDAGKWALSFSSNQATIVSQISSDITTRNYLQANGNPFSLASSFTCTNSTQTDPYIFRNLATLGYQNYMTTCCDKTITIDNPSITDAASSGATITFDQASPVATCEGNKEVVATLTLPAGYQATALSFSVSSGTVSVSPAISTPISSTTAYTLTFSQDQNATLTTTATIAAKSLSSITLAESSVTIYDQQYALIGVTYDPADILTKGYTLTGPALTKLVTTGSTQTQLKISATKAGVTINEEVSETVSIKANADATKTASVSVTIKPLPRVHFADIVHGNAFADVVATIEENALVKDQPTPTPQDIAAPGSSNTCENTHLHLIGWIDSEWSGVVNYLNNTAAAPETSAIIGATGYYYPAGTDIDTDSKNGKTYYAVWAVEE